MVEPWSVVDDPADDDDPPGTADDPAACVPAAGFAVTSSWLPADKTVGRLKCAAGATDRSTVLAVAGIRNAKARKPVIRTTGTRRSFFF